MNKYYGRLLQLVFHKNTEKNDSNIQKTVHTKTISNYD